MAGIGPLPKDPSQRRRRNADITAGATLSRSGPQGPTPELPGDCDYDTRTLSWYETWRIAPQASAFLATDWQRLHMLALLVEQYWQEPRKELLAEIRLNEASLGATAADRVRLRWSIAEEEPPVGRKALAGDKGAASRRSRVLKVVNDEQSGT